MSILNEKVHRIINIKWTIEDCQKVHGEISTETFQTYLLEKVLKKASKQHRSIIFEYSVILCFQ